MLEPLIWLFKAVLAELPATLTGVLVAAMAAVLATLPEGRNCNGCVYASAVELLSRLCLRGELVLYWPRLLGTLDL